MATAVAASDPPVQALELGTRLYETHAEMLLRFCRGRVRDASEAEDAVQTTFVYAIGALRRGIVPENEEAWLTTIAGNVCHWQRRTHARRGLVTEIDLDAIADVRSAPGDHDELIGLDDALASMPEQQRRALVLREWRGVAPAEIAEELDLTPTATHALLTRARSSLALALTVARQPALALVWLVGELRSLVKAIVGSVTAKAGVAAVTVVATTGVTAGLVEKREPDPGTAADTPAVIDSRPAPQIATAAVPRGRASAAATAARRRRPASGVSARPPATVAAKPTAPARREDTPAATPAQSPQPPAATPPEPTPPAAANRSATSQSAAQPTGASVPSPLPEPPTAPKLSMAPKLRVPTLPEVVPPSAPDVPTLPAPPVVEVPSVPPAPETVDDVADVVRQPPTGLLP